MFVLKKNSYPAVLLAGFLYGSCLLDGLVFAFLVSYVALFGFPGLYIIPVYGLLMLFRFAWAGHVAGGIRRYAAFPQKPLIIIVLAVSAYYLVLEILFSCQIIARHCDPESGFLRFIPFARYPIIGPVAAILIVLSLSIEFLLAGIVSLCAKRGSVIWFYLHNRELEGWSLLNLKRTIDSKTGIRISSDEPEYNRVVDVGASYFAIDSNDDLIILENGKQKEEAVVIPKESVTDITFTTLSGSEWKVCYSDGVWCCLPV